MNTQLYYKKKMAVLDYSTKEHIIELSWLTWMAGWNAAVAGRIAGRSVLEQRVMREILTRVKNNEISVEDALLLAREEPFTDLGYAKIDNHRQLRQGVCEVIYGAGKTGEQILGIAQQMHDSGVRTILITQMDADKASYVEKNGRFGKYRYE